MYEKKVAVATSRKEKASSNDENETESDDDVEEEDPENKWPQDVATILTAEGAFEFLFEELVKIDTEFSRELLQKIKMQLTKRRLVPFVKLLRFLQNPDTIKEKFAFDFFKMSPKKDIIKTSSEIWQKYFNRDQSIADDVPDTLPAEAREEITMAERLKLAIGKRTVYCWEDLKSEQCLESDGKRIRQLHRD